MPGLLELLRRTLGERIEVSLDVAADIWPVEVDRAQLEAALLNLAVNARDAMPDGRRPHHRASETASVQASASERAAGAFVAISVADTGIGMTPDVQAARLRALLHDEGERQGHRPRAQHGLRLRAAVARPHRDRQRRRPGHDDPHVPAARRGPAGRSRRRADGDDSAFRCRAQAILVVEDDADVRQVAVSTLRSLGFTVTEAETGDEAAALLRRNGPVRLVLSDVRMPGELTGIDLARLIRREMPDVRVLLTTGYVESDGVVPDVDILYKPYRATDLAERIQTLLQA